MFPSAWAGPLQDKVPKDSSPDRRPPDPSRPPIVPDHTKTGVMDNSAPGDHKVTDANMAREQTFKDQVRQMRQDRPLQPAPPMTYGTWSMDMNGSTVTAVRVTGDMSF